MDISMDFIPATKFKECAPFAMIVQYEPPETPSTELFGILKGTIQIQGDIIEPTGDKWDIDE